MGNINKKHLCDAVKCDTIPLMQQMLLWKNICRKAWKGCIPMKQYETSNIKNIALAGHGGKGKTTLAEAMLYISGGVDRLGRVADGNTVMDFDA